MWLLDANLDIHLIDLLKALSSSRHAIIFCYHDGMIRTQVQLTEEQMEALRRLSARTRRSVADLVRAQG